jgi:hypothetical protein
MNPQLGDLQSQLDALKRSQVPSVSNNFRSGIGVGIRNKAKTGWSTTDTFDRMDWDITTVEGEKALGIGTDKGLAIKTPGIYALLGQVYTTATNMNSDAISAFTKNGTLLSERGLSHASAEIHSGGSHYGGYSIIGFAKLEAGDVVGISLSPQGSTTLTTPARNSSLVIVKLL